MASPCGTSPCVLPLWKQKQSFVSRGVEINRWKRQLWLHQSVATVCQAILDNKNTTQKVTIGKVASFFSFVLLNQTNNSTYKINAIIFELTDLQIGWCSSDFWHIGYPSKITLCFYFSGSPPIDPPKNLRFSERRWDCSRHNLFDFSSRYKKSHTAWNGMRWWIGVPTGIRTPVPTVKGSCPRPLDDGDAI